MPRSCAKPIAPSIQADSGAALSPKAQRRPKLAWDIDMWVKLPEVVDYLRKNGLNITQAANTQEWFMDNKPVYAHQLLMLANKLRLEKNLPIFLVGDVSC